MTKIIDKQQLADKAANLFRMKGYSATSIDDIAKACGITKGSIYHHFPSKEDVALAALEQVHDYYREHIFSIINSRTSPTSGDLKAFNQAVERFFLQHRHGCLLANLSLEVGATYEPFKEKIRHYFDDWTSCYVRVFSTFHAPKKARALAEDAVAIVQGCILMSRIRGNLESLQRQHTQLLQYCEAMEAH